MPKLENYNASSYMPACLNLPCLLVLPCVVAFFFALLQEVRFQTKGGKILNHGRLNEAGSITCHCKQCGGTKGISASEFEEHSGSKDRRPADGIYLEGERSICVCGEHTNLCEGMGGHVLHACFMQPCASRRQARRLHT